MFGRGGPAALCATEKEGAHPRNIATQLVREGDGYRLHGTKRFVTLGPAARVLYVVASRGTTDAGRNDLVVVRLTPREGVRRETLPPFPFVPEIPHGKLVIDTAVEASAILPGDGFSAYLKPFRTVEDLHVSAALTGHLVALARRFVLPETTLEALLAHALALVALAEEPLDGPATHVALAGAFARFSEIADHLDLDRFDARLREGWLRDRALLTVAAQARGLRREAAWERIRAAGA